MLKNIFKTLMMGIALCATCNIVAVNAGQPVQNGKTIKIHGYTSVKKQRRCSGMQDIPFDAGGAGGCQSRAAKADCKGNEPADTCQRQQGRNTAQSTAAKPAAKTTVANAGGHACCKIKFNGNQLQNKRQETMYSIAKKNNTKLQVADLKKLEYPA